MTTRDRFGNLLFIPSREEIENVREGNLLPDCFGRMSPVVRIVYRGVDIHERAYVGAYLEFGTNSSISASYKEGELFRTVPLSFFYTSSQLDVIERDLNATRSQK